MNEKILVAGASGYVGGILVPKLLQRGAQVSCLTRSPEKINARNWPGAKAVKGDVLNAGSLAEALKGIQTAYYLVHAMGQGGDFEKRDALSAANFGRAAADAGVERIIYLGGLGQTEQGLSPHLSSRQEVGRLLGQAGVPVTEFRASIIIGAGSASFEIIRDLVSRLPVMVTPRWVQSRAEPISIDDVIYYLTKCLDDKKTVGETFEIGGGEQLTYGQMMEKVAQVMGKKILMLRLPVLTPRLSSYWLHLVTTVPMSLARPLVEGLRNDTVCHDLRIRDILPLELTPFKTAVESALGVESSESRWTEAEMTAAPPSLLNQSVLENLQRWPCSTPLARLFDAVKRIGGATGWYYGNWVWRLRGALDRLVGGPGMRRGRRHESDLRIGDAVDFWRVVDYDPGSRLKLRAEMKLPGVAHLEFQTCETESGSMLEQRATFVPHGLLGRLYWILLNPLHFFIFRNMARNIVRRAEDF